LLKKDKVYRLSALFLGSMFPLAGGCTAKSQTQADQSRPIILTVDHGVICESELGPIQQAFANVGLRSDYGGRHLESPTQMAILGFEDYSYLGLDTPVTSPAPQGVELGKFMDGNAGPCAWVVNVSDIGREVERVSRLGVKVEDPNYLSRKKPDGTLSKWKKAKLGEETSGAMLPLLLQDITPRSYRVEPSASTKGTNLTGVAIVVLGVRDLEASIALFRRVYSWPAPVVEQHPDFGAKLAYFEGTPVILAVPLAQNSWLSERLDQFGPSPIAFLLGTRNFKTTSARFSFSSATQWFNRKVSWFDPDKLHGVRLGVIDQ
jgi:catechol 2,3-dioxygenase-like lactoylglutathione lyase family enzyme